METQKKTLSEIIQEAQERLAASTWSLPPNVTWRRLGVERAHEYLWGNQAAAGTLGSILLGTQQQAAQNIWNQATNATYGFTDSGDETQPCESNPQPIEQVYTKIESEEEKQIRLWNAVVAASQG